MKKYELKLTSKNDLEVDLLRLMAACNDLMLSTELMSKSVKLSDPKSEVETIKINGERLYYFRLICGHLHEGLVVFRSFCQHKEVRKTFSKSSKEDQEHFDKLLKVTDDSNAQNLFKTILKPLRSDVSFHYPREIFKKSFSELEQTSLKPKMVTGGDKYIDMRYVIVDDILADIYSQKLGDTPQIENFMKTVIEIQTSMYVIVGAYLAEKELVTEL